MLEDGSGLWKGWAQVNESPNPFAVFTEWEPQRLIVWGASEGVKLGDATLMKDDRVVFVNLQSCGEPVYEAVHKEPKHKGRFS